MTPKRAFDGAHLRLLHVDHGHSRLMVTFDFRTPGKSDFGPVNPSRAFADNGFDQLMIKTRTNDWFINAETEAMEAVLAPLAARYKEVRALGYSMGGYGAFRFAAALKARFVAAVSPQMSIDPQVVPFDHRYRAEAKEFDPRLGRLPPHKALTGFIIFDPFVRPDRRHARMLQQMFPEISLLRAGFGGHPASGVLRDAGRGGVVQRAAMGLVPPGRILHLHRAARSGTNAYWSRLSAASATRHPALSAFAARQAASLQENAPDPA